MTVVLIMMKALFKNLVFEFIKNNMELPVDRNLKRPVHISNKRNLRLSKYHHNSVFGRCVLLFIEVVQPWDVSMVLGG